MTSFYRCRGSLSEIARAFETQVPAGLDWQPTLWPGREGLVILHDGERCHLERLNWGLGARTAGTGHRTPHINHLMSGIGFGDRCDPPERCLIVMDSFALPAGEKGMRTQSWFGLDDQPLFAWAGIVRDLPDHGRAYVGILTTSNDMVAPIARLMPALLDAAAQERWLTAPLAKAAKFIAPFPSNRMYVEPTDEPWPGSRGGRAGRHSRRGGQATSASK